MKTIKHARILCGALLALAVSLSFICPNNVRAAETHPVLCVGSLIGAFVDGEWQDAPGEVTVAGKTVNMDDIEKDAVFNTLKNADDGLDCVTTLVGSGQKIAYYGADGIKKHEGAVSRTSIWYEGEASGAAALSIEVAGSDEIDWSELVVGGAAQAITAPAPTTRTVDANGARFTCEYNGEKYTISWVPGKDDAREITLSVGSNSWKLENEGIDPEDLEDLQCGFFDLNGDGALELVVSDSGANGAVALFSLSPDTDPERFAWKYTGEE